MKHILTRLTAFVLLFAAVLSLLPGVTFAAEDKVTPRYVVLLIDCECTLTFTGYNGNRFTYESPLEDFKEAAMRFVDQLDEAGGENHYAVVSYASQSKIRTPFTTDAYTALDAIDGIYMEDSGTDIGMAFEYADSLLSKVTDPNAQKSIILYSKGTPCGGAYQDEGRYTYDDCCLRGSSEAFMFQYANGTYAYYEENIAPKYDVYSVTVFPDTTELPDDVWADMLFFKCVVRDLQNSGFIIAKSAEDIYYSFDRIYEAMTVKPYAFRFDGSLASHDVEATCYYTDSFFSLDAREYDPHLATMSLCLELSSWARSHDKNAKWITHPTSDTNAKCQNAYDLLTKLGYEDFEANDFWEGPPTVDSIGAVAAHKTLPNGTPIIALAIRGGGYEREWSSNFKVGNSGDHEGFADARDDARSFLNAYIRDHNITGDIKLWVVGYSRAGCVANMLGGNLNKFPYFTNGAYVDQSDLYVYTFESPMGALSDETEGSDDRNIHNIVNVNDVVPLVAPAIWGFDRYSDDFLLPTKEALSARDFYDLKETMLGFYDKFLDNISMDESDTKRQEFAYKVADEERVPCWSVQINWSKLLPGGDPFIELVNRSSFTSEELLDKAANYLFVLAFRSRNNYADIFQETMCELLEIYGRGSIDSDWVSRVTMHAKEIFTKDALVDCFKPVLAVNFDSSEERLEKVQNNINSLIRIAFYSDLVSLGVEDPDSILDDVYTLAWNTVLPVVSSVLNGNTEPLDVLISAVMMFMEHNPMQAHYSEVTLSWMMALDSFYTTTENDGEETPASYRILRINCPVTVNVYNHGTSRTMAAFSEGYPMDVSLVQLRYYRTPDGEMVIYLPAGDAFDLDLRAYDSGSMTVTIEEYDIASESVTRVVSFRDIPLARGDRFTSTIPALPHGEVAEPIPEGSSAVYKLGLNSSVEFRGADLIDDAYEVTLSRNNDLGTVSGGGSFGFEHFAQVEATPLENVTFLGWYQNGSLVSSDPVYRFSVREDTSLEARFENKALRKVTFTASEGGSVANEAVAVTAGTKITLKAVADDGYTFAGWSAGAGSFESTVSAETTFTVPDKDVTVTARFTDNSQPPAPEKPVVNRLAGARRTETAVEIAKASYQKSTNAVLASSLNYADALAGAPLAYALDAPILLVGNKLDQPTLDELASLGVRDITILGGEVAVSKTVEDALKNAGYRTTRIAGGNRYETAVKIAEKLQELNGTPTEEAFFASAENYPDALAISAVASIRRAPILYVSAKGKLKETETYFDTYKVSSAVLLGGTVAIADAAIDNLKSQGVRSVERVWGDNRYETCLAINRQYSSDLDEREICVATGINYPDALTGGVYAALKCAPMLLVNNKKLTDTQKSYLASTGAKVVTVFGGESAVSDNMVSLILAALE